MKSHHVFFAHAVGAPSQEISASCGALKNLLSEKFARAGKEGKVAITSGKDDFALNFKGSWDDWTKSIARRKDSITLEREYDLIIVVSRFVGKATSMIIAEAVLVGMPVFLWQDGALSRITQVRTDDPEDWQGGFALHPGDSP